MRPARRTVTPDPTAPTSACTSKVTKSTCELTRHSQTVRTDEQENWSRSPRRTWPPTGMLHTVAATVLVTHTSDEPHSSRFRPHSTPARAYGGYGTHDTRRQEQLRILSTIRAISTYDPYSTSYRSRGRVRDRVRNREIECEIECIFA